MSSVILISGGAGNVASDLVKMLVENKNNFIVIIDNLSNDCLSRVSTSREYRVCRS